MAGITAPSLDLVRSFNLAPCGRRALCCASLAQLTAAFRPSPAGTAAATAAGEVASSSVQQDAAAPCTAADGLPSNPAQALPVHLQAATAEAAPPAENDQQQARAVVAVAAVAALVGSTAGAAAALGSGEAEQRPHDPDSALASQPPAAAAAAAVNGTNEVIQPMEVEGAPPGACAALETHAAAAPSQEDGAASAAMPADCNGGPGGGHAGQGGRGRCRSPVCPLRCPLPSTHAVLSAAIAVGPAIVVPVHSQAESPVRLVWPGHPSVALLQGRGRAWPARRHAAAAGFSPRLSGTAGRNRGQRRVRLRHCGGPRAAARCSAAAPAAAVGSQRPLRGEVHGAAPVVLLPRDAGGLAVRLRARETGRHAVPE